MTLKFLLISAAFVFGGHLIAALVTIPTGWNHDTVTTYVFAGMIGALVGRVLDLDGFGGR